MEKKMKFKDKRMKNCLLKQLKDARKQAKKEGVQSYGEEARLHLMSDRSFINLGYKFELKGLKPPYSEVVLPLQKLIWTLQAAKRITSDYKIKWDLPYKLCIYGKNNEMKFSMLIPFIKAVRPCSGFNLREISN
jgi:hypothetical protein